MYFIFAPTAGHLAVMSVEPNPEPTGEEDQEIVKPVTYGVPDAEFWDRLDNGDFEKYRLVMEEENPARLIRARAFVGPLRSQKEAILKAGFTNEELVSARPTAVEAGKRVAEIKVYPKAKTLADIAAIER